jgi:hypothetical protein
MSEERFIYSPGLGRPVAVEEVKPKGSPPKVQRPKEIFVGLTMFWHRRLDRLSGKTQTVGRHILELQFKNFGRPFKLTNGPLLAKGIGKEAKWLALNELEALDLINVERHPRKSPIVQALHTLEP